MKFDLRKGNAKYNLTLSLATVVLLLLALEVTLRFFITPARFSYGTLFGIELPPFELIPQTSPPSILDRALWYNDLIVEGRKITIGDLWGFFRQDPLLGYAPQENMVSANGWWQSNNIGARARYDTSEGKSAGRKRMLVFGDSFAIGSRVRQEEMWSAFLESGSERLEVVNLGVDGYGMGQSFLRYSTIKDKLDYDLVLLIFVPASDLWRDINTRRDLFGDWDLYWVMPRFILEQGQLKLIRGPFEVEAGVSEQDPGILDDRLLNHLKSYDRFYFRMKYEEPDLIGNSILYKLFARAYYEQQRKRLLDGLLTPDSEALQVSKQIFHAMNEEVKQRAAEFVLVFMPSHRDLRLLERDVSYRDDWLKMVSSTCTHDLICIDLSEDLRQLSKDQLDKGYDGTHYGPEANRLIAEFLRNHLELENVLVK